jgi:carbon storage regulator CsrA
MLVLTRRENQSVILTIGNQRIRVVVVGIGEDGNRVKLGFDASHEVEILREELDTPYRTS